MPCPLVTGGDLKDAKAEGLRGPHGKPGTGRDPDPHSWEGSVFSAYDKSLDQANLEPPLVL